MNNYIEITSLAVSTVIGAYTFEEYIKQTLLIDIKIYFPFQEIHDEIAKTIDYSILCNKVTEMVTSRSFRLIESVAQQVAELIKTEFNVTSFRICVHKPNAVKNAKNISYILES